MSRLLLERVTAYCGARTRADYKEARPVRFEFSDRVGVKIKDIREYYAYLRAQSRMGLMHNTFGNLDWSVVDTAQMFSFPNNMRAGLQLADIAASAFFSGLELTSHGILRPEPAKLLLPRVCRNRKGKCFGFGVKFMPALLRQLSPEQNELIDFYRAR